MKQKLTTLIIIAGGLTMAFGRIFDFVPPMLLAIICGLALGIGIVYYTSVYGGVIWGIKLPSAGGTLNTLIGVIGLFLGGYGIVNCIIAIALYLSQGKFINIPLLLVLYIIPLAIGPSIAKKVLEKSLAKKKTAMCLEQFPIFQEIEQHINEATYFVVSFEGIALYSNTNYCYAVFLYENYQLGSLSSPQEVALVGTYFVQKYSDKFTFKVDVEVIPGEPGQTVVAVGTGGIGVARVQGTPDQHLFRSYIFTRK